MLRLGGVLYRNIFIKNIFLKTVNGVYFPDILLLSQILRLEIEEIHSTAGERYKKTILDIQSSKLTFFLICKTSPTGVM